MLIRVFVQNQALSTLKNYFYETRLAYLYSRAVSAGRDH